MKSLLPVLLSFVLSINVILAQVATINIVTPYSNGLSNNQVNDFDVNADGTILNNSASGGTAQLGNTAVTGNSNITADSEADLILFQVTTNNDSTLEGKIEVFGAEAGVIIANPNGISCNGCGFINVSKVELVTGAANFSGDDLTNFSIDSSSTLTVNGNGFVGDAVVDELNLVSRDLRINAQVKANNTLRVLAGNDTYDHTTNIITSNNPEAIQDLINISSVGSLEANFIELISTESNTSVFNVLGVLNEGGDISADTLNIDSNGAFRSKASANILATNFSVLSYNFINSNNSTINADSFTVTTENRFDNNSTISADSFTVTAKNEFYNDSAKITADSFNVTVGNHFHNYSSTISANIFTVEAGSNFINQSSGTISTNNFNVTAGEDFYNQFGVTISTDNFNVTVGDDFYNQFGATINANSFDVTANYFYDQDVATINADNFHVTAGYYFANYATINANDFNVSVGRRFSNYATINTSIFNVTAGDELHNQDGATISADTVTIEVTNFYNDISNTGTISSGSLNFILTDDFTHTGDSFNSFNNFNNLGITTAGDYTQRVTIDIAGNFNIQVGGEISLEDTAFIKARNLFFSAYKFFNQADITIADNATFDIENFFGNGFDYLGTTYNGGYIIADNFTVTTRLFSNQNYATINANSFNVVAQRNFVNQDEATIDADTVTIEVTNFDNNISNTETVSSDSLNLTIGGDFVHNSTTLNNFTFNNLAFTIAGDYTQGASIDIAGDLRIQVSGEASLDVSNTGAVIKARNLFFSAYDLWSQADITITENATFDLENDFKNGFKLDGTDYDGGNISANSFNVTAGNDFINRYNATINANSFNVAVEEDFSNQSHIYGDEFNVTATNFYNNFGILGIWSGVATANVTVAEDFEFIGGYISTGTLNITVGRDFTSDYTAIYALHLNITVGNDFVNQNLASILVLPDDPTNPSTTDNFKLKVGNKLYNTSTISSFGTLTIEATNFVNDIHTTTNITSDSLNLILTDDFHLTRTSLNFFDFDNLSVYTGGDFNNRTTLTVNDLNVIASGTFYNNYATINANNLNVTAYVFSNVDSSTISADSLNVTVHRFSNYYNSTINVNDFNVTARDGFENRDNTTIITDTLAITAGDIIYNDANVTATSLTIDTGSVHNSGNITATSLNINAKDDVFSGGSIKISALDIEAGRNFGNGGTISTDSLNITAGYTALNTGTIVSNSLDITTDNFFRNLTGGDINVATLNITAGGKVTNIATINAGTLNIIANNNSSSTNDPTGFYVSNRGDIIADNFVITAEDNFYNTGDITADTLAIIAKNILLLNADAMFTPYDGGDILLSGNSSFTADGRIENYGNIDLGGFDLDVIANSFTNDSVATISDGTLDIDVNSFINNGSITATINQ